MVSKVQMLKDTPLFSGLSKRALEQILKMGTIFEAPRGSVLVQPHQGGSGMFVVEEGSVVVEKPGHKPIELGPGSIFGELSLLTETLRSARVRAKTDVKCLAISREDFKKLLTGEPKVALALLEVLAARLASGS